MSQSLIVNAPDHDELIFVALQRIHANCNFFFYNSATDEQIKDLCKYMIIVIKEFNKLPEDAERSFEYDNNELDSPSDSDKNDESESDDE